MRPRTVTFSYHYLRDTTYNHVPSPWAVLSQLSRRLDESILAYGDELFDLYDPLHMPPSVEELVLWQEHVLDIAKLDGTQFAHPGSPFLDLRREACSLLDRLNAVIMTRREQEILRKRQREETGSPVPRPTSPVLVSGSMGRPSTAPERRERKGSTTGQHGDLSGKSPKIIHRTTIQ